MDLDICPICLQPIKLKAIANNNTSDGTSLHWMHAKTSLMAVGHSIGEQVR